MEALMAWLAPILSALVICAGQLMLNRRFKRSDEKRERERKRAADEQAKDDEWKSEIIKRLDCQDKKIDDLLDSQCSQIRSDIIHKAHRYLDDMGCASVEEKNSLFAEYEDYLVLCEQTSTQNHFIDKMIDRIVSLPEREL